MTAYILTEPDTKIYMFADDIVILSKHKTIETATTNQQNQLSEIESWTEANKIKINLKRAHITFIRNKNPSSKIYFQNLKIPLS